MSAKKDEKTIRRHAWPPPQEAERVVMPHYFVSTEERGSISRYTLVRVVNGTPEHVIGTTKYKDLLETIIQDALVPVFKASPLHLVEAMLGEARWKYGDEYAFAKQPDYLLEPDFEGREEDEEPESELTQLKLIPPAEFTKGPRICPVHNIEKLRNGCRLCRQQGMTGTMFQPTCPLHGKKHKSGMKGEPKRQSYKCPGCQNKEPATVAPSATPEPLPNRTAPTRLRDERGLLPESYLDYCREHKRTKATNQPTPRGMTYRCADCVKANRGKPRGGRRSTGGDRFTEARKVALSNKMKDNAKCVTCSEPLRKGKLKARAADGTPTEYYWKRCVNGCTRTGQESEQRRNQLPDSFEELLPIIEEKVARRNGHHPQNRKDIVQEIALLVWQKAWTLDDLDDPKRLRRIINQIQGQYADKFAPKGGSSKSLDQPVREGDPDATALLAFQSAVASDSDPHQQLEAKETVNARLNGGAPTSNPEEELIAKEAGGSED